MDKGAFQVRLPVIPCHVQTDSHRKARALVGMDRLEEARDALIDGLQFEPQDKVRLRFSEATELIRQELNTFLEELDGKLKEAE